MNQSDQSGYFIGPLALSLLYIGFIFVKKYTKNIIARSVGPLFIVFFLGPIAAYGVIYGAATAHFMAENPTTAMSTIINQFLLIIFEILCFGILYANLGLRNQSTMIETNNIYDCSYFSVVTWTTVGYGDLVPNTKLCRLLVSYELIIGYFTMAGFLAQIISFISAHRI